MENSTSFDLNESIRLWREKIAATPAVCAADLDELEAHLRDSIRALEAKGLAPDEAFLIATRRAGHPQTLGAEFAKLKPETVWLNRAFWMVAGYLTIGLFGAVSSTLARVAGVGLHMLKFSSQTMGALEFAVNSAIFIALLRWLWLSANRPASFLWRAANWFKARPAALGLSVFVMLVAKELIGVTASYFEARTLTHEHAISISYAFFSAAVFSLLIWPVAFGWLMKRTQAVVRK